MASTQESVSAFLLLVTLKDTLELLKIAGQGCSLVAWFEVTLAGALAWTAVAVMVAFRFGRPIENLMTRIVKLAFKGLGIEGSVDIGKELDKVAANLPDTEDRVPELKGIIAGRDIIEAEKATQTAPKSEKAQALRDLMGRELEFFEKLVPTAVRSPILVMDRAFAILKKMIVETATVYGFVPSGDYPPLGLAQATEATEALFFITTRVLGSDNVMVNTYSLAAALQKAKESTAPAEDVRIRDAQDFVRYCMAIVAELSFAVDKLLEPKS
jgi:hypothetical protein